MIVTLGTGFAVAGFTQIMTSIGSKFAGNVFGVVPGWLSNLAAMNGRFFGMKFPPTIIIWIGIAILMIVGLRMTSWGRNLYALGGNRGAAKLLGVSELKYWVACYVISGVFAALTGALLLGWSGGAFIGVGDPYLFTTLAGSGDWWHLASWWKWRLRLHSDWCSCVAGPYIFSSRYWASV